MLTAIGSIVVGATVGWKAAELLNTVIDKTVEKVSKHVES